MSLDKSNLEELHEQWLRHPITVQAMKLLFEFREQHVATVSANVTNIAVTDTNFRGMAINIKNTDAIIEMLTNGSKFVNKVHNNPNKQ